MTRARTLLVLGVVAVVVAGGFFALRAWRNRTPYGPDALHATATVFAVTNEEAQALMTPFPAPVAAIGDQLIAGTVTWQSPPKRGGGVYDICLIDKRTNLAPAYLEPTDSHVIISGCGFDADLAAKYPWMRGTISVDTGHGWTIPSGLEAPTNLRSVTFVAIFPKADPEDPNSDLHASAPIAAVDLIVALVFVSNDRRVYWAQRLYG